MKYTESLKKTYEFNTVYRKGKSFANKYLVLYKYKNEHRKVNMNKLGISVSKKVGKSVVRSRVTRLIRESYRLQEDNIEVDSFDFVIVARTAAKDATFDMISNALIHLLKLHEVYRKK
jgi:ribonuclease P protein component